MLLLILACAAAPDPLPCDPEGDPSLELAPADVEFGAFETGDPLPYGNPPQGGAPFSPYHARIHGLADLDDHAVESLTATDDDDGTLLGETTYELRLVCANVGDNAGQWLGADLHQRFNGWSLDDLEGRHTTIRLAVTAPDGNEVATSISGVLVRM